MRGYPEDGSAARRHELRMLLPGLVELLDLVWRGVAGEVTEPFPADVANPVRAARRKVHGCVGSEHARLPARRHLASSLEDVVHRFDGAMLVDRRRAARPDVDHGDHELARPDIVRADDLVRAALVAFQGLRRLAMHDLHGSTPLRKVRWAFGVF